jgi:hypothetical protein
MSVVASLLPFSAALAMPVRIVVLGVPAWQIGLSLAILLGSVALLIPLAGRLYAGAVLRMGPHVKLRDALEGGRLRPSGLSQPSSRCRAVSGSCPSPRRRSWKSLSENEDPSRSEAAARARSISIMPTMYDSAWPGSVM